MFQYYKPNHVNPCCSFFNISSPCGAFGIRNAIADSINPSNPNSDKEFHKAAFCFKNMFS